MKIEESIEVEVPLHSAYNQWTQFEEYPRFMDNVESVRQLDDQRLHWIAKVGGDRKEWDARITRQEPDQVIAWQSESGAQNNGTVSFSSLGPQKTKIDVTMEVETDGIKEQVGSAIGVPGAAVKGDLERFKDFIEGRGVETGAWRGEVPPRS